MRYRMVWEIEEQAKKRGMAVAEGAGGRDVQIARDIARELWEALGHYDQTYMGAGVSMDDVRRVLAERHPDIEVGNWAGSVFKASEWEPVGWVQSTHAGGHRRAIRTWRWMEVAR